MECSYDAVQEKCQPNDIYYSCEKWVKPNHTLLKFCINFCTSVIYNVIMKKICLYMFFLYNHREKNYVLTIQFKIILYLKKKNYTEWEILILCPDF